MKARWHGRERFFALLCFSIAVMPLPASTASAGDETHFSPDDRVPWTTSHLVGSPEPPLPYTIEKAFAKIEWHSPLYVAPEPGTRSLLVVEQGGERDRPSRVHRIADEPGAELDRGDVFLELDRRLIYSVAFHPSYTTNGELFVFSHGPPGEDERTNRIVRFAVDREPPYRPDLESKEIILEWKSGGHDGGDMVFGNDGMLYITAGDGTSDSDVWNTGQDLSDLLGGVLRIDVDHPRSDTLYSVPPDNPFVDLAGARPEIWAYGLRNPWRMTVDRKTGAIWVGNNGQDLWETAVLLRRGENYGWSIYEGSHPFYLHRAMGPTPHVAPTIEHHHREARSLTGGIVYRGDVFPELDGVYIYGDYSTGKIWGARHNGTRVTWHRELADTTLQIAAFAVGHRGDVYIVDHGGGIVRLVRAPETGERPPFPKRLSETGLFASVAEHEPAPGVLSYEVNAPGWADGAVAERFFAVPGDGRIGYSGSRAWNLPDGTVLAQTLFVDRGANDTTSRRPIETRVLLRQEGEWAGYSYRWNEDGSDAELVSADGDEVEWAPPGVGGEATGRKWRFPSRAECLSCHSRAVGFVLGLSTVQVNCEHDYGDVRANQIRALAELGVLEGAPRGLAKTPRLVDPYDSKNDLDARARSYLHANCSGCHVEAGGGNAKMELEATTSRERMNIFGSRPQHDTFGIANAMIIAPGDPDRSVLYQRLSRRGRGQMPPLVSTEIDERAVDLFREWIASMPPERAFVKHWRVDDIHVRLDGDELRSGRSFETGRAVFQKAGCGDCHRFGGSGGTVGPDLGGIAARRTPLEILESILSPSKAIAPEFAMTDVVTKKGEVITGRIEYEDGEKLVLRPRAARDETVAIARSEIVARAPSEVSNMPDGILDTFESEEILDLLAYIIAGGDPEHAAFR